MPIRAFTDSVLLALWNSDVGRGLLGGGSAGGCNDLLGDTVREEAREEATMALARDSTVSCGVEEVRLRVAFEA